MNQNMSVVKNVTRTVFKYAYYILVLKFQIDILNNVYMKEMLNIVLTIKRK